jgi:hypothetical protein
MLSFGKVNAAAVHATQELTAAAANLNLDFSLIKIEAPHEFQALGNVLSKDRRKDAEDGLAHITARKLAVLFEPSLIRTPELVKAYGLRASQIAGSPDLNPQGSAGKYASSQDKSGPTPRPSGLQQLREPQLSLFIYLYVCSLEPGMPMKRLQFGLS